MQNEALQYDYSLDQLAQTMARWKEDIDKNAAYIDEQRAQGKAVGFLETRLNWQRRYYGMTETHADIANTYIQKLHEVIQQQATPGNNTGTDGYPTAQNYAPAGRTLVRDIPASLHSEVQYTQDLILGMHEWIVGIDEKLTALTTVTNGDK